MTYKYSITLSVYSFVYSEFSGGARALTMGSVESSSIDPNLVFVLKCSFKTQELKKVRITNSLTLNFGFAST